jgi:hypothetical protein
MKRFALATALFCAGLLAIGPMPAHAGERYLGSIVSGAGADTTNISTAAPFVIPGGARLTIQCTATAYVIGDTTTAVTATNGVTVPADAIFLTKQASSPMVPVTVSLVVMTTTILRIAGPAAVTCDVFARNGDE